MNLDERDAVAARFGVPPEQVERDHLISHLLAALSDRFADRLHFIGGTALARTHLPNGRLAEAAYLFKRHGPTNRPPSGHLFDRPPCEDDWVSQLAGQTRLTVTAVTALTIVRDAWARAANRDLE